MIYLITNKKFLFEFNNIKLTTKEHLLEWLKDKTEIEVDTETEFNKNKDVLPDPYRYKMLCIQIGNYKDQFVIDKETVNILFLKPVLEDSKITKLFVNALFDIRYIIHEGINIKNVYDLFLGEMLLTLNMDKPKGYRSLQGMAMRYCNIALDKTIRGEIYWRVLDELVITYAANDVKYLGLIKKEQYKIIENQNLTKAISLQNLFIISLARMAYNGFKLDINKWLELANTNKKKLSEKFIELEDFTCKNYTKFISVQLNLLGSPNSGIDWNSPKQVVKLFNKLEIPIEIIDKKTGEFKNSTEYKHLKKFEKIFPILPIFFEYKEFQKSCSTYGEKFLNWVNPVTNRIHGEFFPILKTGRISSNNPNLQNIPSEREYRSCFIAEEGKVLITCDYSQQEPRITADKCQDSTLLDLFLNGDGDTHSTVASKMYSVLLGKEVIITKKNPYIEIDGKKIDARYNGKVLNLKLDYGGSAYTVKDDLAVSEQEAQSFIDALKIAFPQKESYFQEVIKKTFKDGFITIDSITNMRSNLEDIQKIKDLEKIPKEQWTKGKGGMWSTYFKLKGGAERDAKNYPIQGTAGNMSKLAMIFIDNEIENNNWRNKVKIVNAVHDEIVLESDINISKEVSIMAKNCMEKAGKVFCKTVPMLVEPEIHNCWQK